MTAAIILSVVFLVRVVAADDPQTRSSQNVVPVEVYEVDLVAVQPGSTATIRVPVRVAEGYRVQANPASSEFLVPVEIELEDVDGLVFGAPVYPESEPYRLEGADDDLKTYQGNFEIVVPVSAHESAATGNHDVTAVFRYQACNARMCLFPASVAIGVPVVVKAFEEPAKE